MKTQIPNKSKPITATLEKLKKVIADYYRQRLQNSDFTFYKNIRKEGVVL